MAEWQRVLAKSPDILDQRIDRGTLEAELRTAGYGGKRYDGETVFLKPMGDVSFVIFPGLKTLNGTDRHAPSQRLSLSGGQSYHRAVRVERHLRPDQKHLPILARAQEVSCREFVVTLEQTRAAIAQMEEAFAACDVDASLTFNRNLDPSEKGGAGLKHLVALILAGDVPRLQAYDDMRRAGQTAGFWPYVTDAMIHTALDLAETVRDAGPEALDARLA